MQCANCKCLKKTIKSCIACIAYCIGCGFRLLCTVGMAGRPLTVGVCQVWAVLCARGQSPVGRTEADRQLWPVSEVRRLLAGSWLGPVSSLPGDESLPRPLLLLLVARPPPLLSAAAHCQELLEKYSELIVFVFLIVHKFMCELI